MMAMMIAVSLPILLWLIAIVSPFAGIYYLGKYLKNRQSRN